MAYTLDFDLLHTYDLGKAGITVPVVLKLGSKEIAVELGIILPTVEAHRWNIAQKIRAGSTIGIIKFALKTGIIQL
jgi:FixJ family two-component response regulator